MRIFVTGATGFIGLAVVKELIGAGHEVVGLARSEASAKKLVAIGARAHVGVAEDLQSLRKGASGSHAAVHLAFYHQLSHAPFATLLRIFFGGSPGGIVSRFLAAAVKMETQAIETLGSALTGPDRALVFISPTMALTAGRLGKESDAPDPQAVGGGRAVSEKLAASLATRGVRASIVRLPPSVHDREKQGFVSQLIETARKKRRFVYVGDGQNRWGAVHVLDAARLIRLALEKGSAGKVYHAIGEEGIPLKQIGELVGRELRVPVVSGTAQEAAKLYSWLAPFVAADNPVSSQWTRQALGWKPEHPGLLSDLEQATCFKS